MIKKVCLGCKEDLEAGSMVNMGLNWSSREVFGRKLSEKLTGSKSVVAFRCPKCGLIQQYTLDKVEEVK
jgi:hypothetical protein